MNKAKIWDKELDVKLEQYYDGHNRIQCYLNGEPYATASYNADGLKVDEVAIKDYGENEGILQGLIAAGAVQAPHAVISVGFADLHICKLNKEWFA